MAKNFAPKHKMKPQQPKQVDFQGPIYSKKRRAIILVVVALIVLSMSATLIIPYIGNMSKGYWKLPEDALKSNRGEVNDHYNNQSITLGEVYNRSEKEYYVLIGKPADFNEVIPNLARVNYYTVDVTQFFNKSAGRNVVSGPNLPTNPEQIKVKDDVALLKIVDGKAVSYINNKNQVIEYAKKLN